MPTVNPCLWITDFKVGQSRFGWSMRASDVAAFAGTVSVATLNEDFQLFKLTVGEAPAGRFGVTPWWSPVRPFREDEEGALGRFEQAKLNGIDMSSMVRYMSAVCIDWNSLDNYIQVKIAKGVTIKCFWGKYAPQKLFSTGIRDQGMVDRVSATTSRGFSNAVLPNDLGALEAWQFYIPGLKEEHIVRDPLIPAHDMAALQMHFLGHG